MSMIGAIGPLKRIADSPRYKWWAFSAISIGLFLTVLDQSGVNIALPKIADHFGADIPTVQWISLSYVLSTSVMLMPLGPRNVVTVFPVRLANENVLVVSGQLHVMLVATA